MAPQGAPRGEVLRGEEEVDMRERFLQARGQRFEPGTGRIGTDPGDEVGAATESFEFLPEERSFPEIPSIA